MALNYGRSILIQLECICIKKQFNPMNITSCLFDSMFLNNFIFQIHAWGTWANTINRSDLLKEIILSQ